MAGLVPFLFMAAYSSGSRTSELTFQEGERVVVYALPACCRDADYTESLQTLLARLPSDAVVLEAPSACACAAGAGPGFHLAPGSRGLRDTVVTAGRRVLVPKEQVASYYVELADLYPMPYAEAEGPMPAVAGVPVPPGPRIGGGAAVPRWIGLLAVPLAFLAGGGGDDPPGLICPDSGLPTGEERNRC